jgi:hypothetical protein
MFRSSSTFKVVNSWGDWWGTNGTYEIPYSVITTPMRDPSGKLVPPHIGSVRYVENRPTSLSLADPFTARIRLRHNQNRNLVKVSVSVGAEQPKVLWGHGTVFGSSTNLCIDVPLPRYARQYWPPNASHTWRVLVQELTPTASSSARQVGTVEEITLVQRLVDAQGRCLPVVCRPSARTFPINEGQTTEIYVPSTKHDMLTLGVHRPQIPAGQSVRFSGRLVCEVGLSNILHPELPDRNRLVSVIMTKNDPIEGTIAEYGVGSAITDQNGQYQVTCTPSESGDYQAIATAPDHTVLASSNFVRVNVT